MNLDKMPKSDLIWIIKRMQVYQLGDIAFNRALDDLEYEKAERDLLEADKQIQVASDARKEYINLLKPYDGFPIVSIPTKVLEDAGNALKRAEEADKKWAKLSKFKRSSRK